MDVWLWSLAILVVTYVVHKALEKKSHFRNYGIPQPSEIPFLGVFGKDTIIRRYIGYALQDLYNLNREAKYIGVHSFLSPVLIVRDLELVKDVLVKNFDHFADRQQFVDEVSDPLFAKNLSAINGDRWREIRNLLSPAFTASKLRTMHVLMTGCADNFVKQFVKKFGNKDAVDTKDAITRYANDVIASCAFGIEVDSLKNPNNEFYLNGKRSTDFTRLSLFFKMIIWSLWPWMGRKCGFRFVEKKESEFFINLIETTIKTRESRGIYRPDMLQLLMESKEKKANLDFLDMTAQAFIFFFAGFDTVSTTLCFLIHELALNPDIQDKLKAEVDAVMDSCDGQPTYEAINNMSYLDAVFNETLRVHPLAFLGRVCSKKFEFPPAVPGAKPYTVKPGMEILVPSSAIQKDPDYYEDPEKFDPERYVNKKLTTSDPTALGFGLGPRMCIGNRFAIHECKVLMVYLLSKCNLLPSKKTCNPMVYSNKSFTPLPEGGFWIKIRPRDT